MKKILEAEVQKIKTYLNNYEYFDVQILKDELN